MKVITVALTAALVVALAVPVSAATVPLTVSMDGAQANAGAGTGSPGSGSATLSFDTVTKSLTWSITWSDLTGTPALMHFHGPALPNQNAGVQVDTGVAGPPVVGNAILSASQEADMMNGLWYLNLHTDAFPGGEIRGTVVSGSVPIDKLSLSLMKARFND
jgi:hypothetical protein